MSKRIVALDVGGSGCRAAWVNLAADGSHHVDRVHHLGSPGSYAALARSLRDTFGSFDRLGVSTAGVVDALRGEVRLCRVQSWIDGPLAQRLKEELGGCHVRIVNDGEAHLLAHLGTPAIEHPTLCLAFGTSVGFGMTDEAGKVVRPRLHTNWEIGSLRTQTRASQSEVWWALGKDGLAELQQTMGDADGTSHFGYRIGGLVRDFSCLFQPRVVVLAGGIIDRHHHTLMPTIHAELEHSLPEQVDKPRLVISPFDDDSGLVGAAVAAS